MITAENTSIRTGFVSHSIPAIGGRSKSSTPGASKPGAGAPGAAAKTLTQRSFRSRPRVVTSATRSKRSFTVPDIDQVHSGSSTGQQADRCTPPRAEQCVQPPPDPAEQQDSGQEEGQCVPGVARWGCVVPTGGPVRLHHGAPYQPSGSGLTR